jgi:hypothetical protein
MRSIVPGPVQEQNIETAAEVQPIGPWIIRWWQHESRPQLGDVPIERRDDRATEDERTLAGGNHARDRKTIGRQSHLATSRTSLVSAT